MLFRSNYKPYPPNNDNQYGNSYGNSYNNNRGVSSDLESMLKDFITSQKSFNKIVEEKLEKLDNLILKVDSLSHEVDFLKIIFLPHDVKEHKTLNAIQVTIDNNIRMLAELHARWEREEKEAEIAEISKVANVCTIYTNEDIKMLNAQESSTTPKYANGKRIGVGKFSPYLKRTQNFQSALKLLLIKMLKSVLVIRFL